MSIFERALRQSPRSATLLVQMAAWAGEFGYLDQSLAFARHAHDLEPDAPLGRIAMARSHLWLGDLEAARDWLRLAEETGDGNLKLAEQQAAFYQEAGQYAALDAYAAGWLDRLGTDPANPPDYHGRMVLGWAGIGRLLMHDYDSAVTLLERALAADEGRRQLEDAQTLVYLALAYSRSAREPDARAVLAEAAQVLDRSRRQGAAWPYVALLAAQVAALDRRPDDALELLRQAVDAGWRRFGLVENHVAFDSLRNDDRYRALVRQMRAGVSTMRSAASAIEPAAPGRVAVVD
jgi:tetratricopeptide (TPR) repeat protein